MESYVKLQNLIQNRKAELGNTFERMAIMLQDSGENGVVLFRILKDNERLYWCLALTSKYCKATAEKAEKPNLEVVTRAETWWQIAKGTLSPLEAFLQGKMRIRGDVELGKRLMKLLASSDGKLDIC